MKPEVILILKVVVILWYALILTKTEHLYRASQTKQNPIPKETYHIAIGLILLKALITLILVSLLSYL